MIFEKVVGYIPTRPLSLSLSHTCVSLSHTQAVVNMETARLIDDCLLGSCLSEREREREKERVRKKKKAACHTHTHVFVTMEKVM